MANVSAFLLSAGLGSRLAPLTECWPKCMMPIGGRPLLEYWLCTLYRSGIREVLVNTCSHSEKVNHFLSRNRFSGWVASTYEPKLLGTAGSLIENADVFIDSKVILIHADNWCQCDFQLFLEFHNQCRPEETDITMMTFRTVSPSTCGIVEIDGKGIVQGFHEKVSRPPGNLANGAVYILEPVVLDWLLDRRDIKDFSTEVLPHFVGKISTWENVGIHRDIGTLNSLFAAQNDPIPNSCWDNDDNWLSEFKDNPIHKRLALMSS